MSVQGSKCCRKNCKNIATNFYKTCQICRDRDAKNKEGVSLCIAPVISDIGNKTCQNRKKYGDYCGRHKSLAPTLTVAPTHGICSRRNHLIQFEDFKILNGKRLEICISCWETKNQWREENPEVYAKSWLEPRHRSKMTNIEAFRLKNNETSKRYRKKYPEKYKEYLERNKNNINIRLGRYKTQCEYYKVEWSITDEQAIDLFMNDCVYCGVPANPFNGIDRIENEIGYTETNVCSCCEICNKMKNSLCIDIFIAIVSHIYIYKCCNPSQLLYPQLFNDYKGSDYNHYKTSSEKREILFLITEIEYNNVKQGICFYCGKQNTSMHQNGIDRIDNSKGYIIDNCTPCCGTCNYIKRNYPVDVLLEKCKLIYEKKHPIVITPNMKTEFLKKGIKTKQFTTEEKEIRKQEIRNRIDNRQSVKLNTEFIEKRAQLFSNK